MKGFGRPSSTSSLALIVTALLLLSWVPSLISADRGGIPLGGISLVSKVEVLEPGQKAIIAWNGREEVLILSTDVKANQSTLVLELLPLPSNPKAVERANYTSFIKLQEIIRRHMGFYVLPSVNLLQEAGVGNFEETVVITFHEKIGAHDITVVRAENASELALWIDDFLRKNAVTNELSLQEYESIFEDYISRGFPYFALDLVEVSHEERSVEPILYHFETSFLYYPLKISSLFSGDTGITLCLLTHYKVDIFIYYRQANYPWATSLVFVDENRTKAYAPANFTWSLGKIFQFNLTDDELKEIDLRLESLFNGSAVLTLLEYKGALDIFTGDLILREGEALVAYPFVPSFPFTAITLNPPEITNLKVVPSNLITIKTLEEVRVGVPSHEVMVLVDYHSPVIGSIDYSMLIDGSVSIQCQVQDSMSGIDDVTLFYRVEGEEWKSGKMREADGRFVATIPLEPYENLNFYVEASDLVGNRAVEDNDATYYQVDVKSYTPSLIFRNVGLLAVCILAAGLIAFIAKTYVEKRDKLQPHVHAHA